MNGIVSSSIPELLDVNPEGVNRANKSLPSPLTARKNVPWRCCNLLSQRMSTRWTSPIVALMITDLSEDQHLPQQAEEKKMSAHILVAKDDNLSGCLTSPGIPPHPLLCRLWATEIVFMLHLRSTALWKLGMQHWPSILSKSVLKRP